MFKNLVKKIKGAAKKIAPYAGVIAGMFGAGPLTAAGIGALGGGLTGGGKGAVLGGLGGYGAGTMWGGKKGMPNCINRMEQMLYFAGQNNYCPCSCSETQGQAAKFHSQ